MMHLFRKRFTIGLIAVCFLSFSGLAQTSFAKSQPKAPVFEILRDSYGVPHIYAAKTYDLFFGYGYAIATDRLFQMEMAKRSFTGTVAEVLGAAYKTYDISVRSNYWPDSIRQQYAALPPKDKEIFEGYAAGFNTRVAEVLADPENLLPIQFAENDFLPQDWSAYDVIMIFIGTMCNRFSDFNSELSNAAYWEFLSNKYDQAVAWQILNQTKWVNDPASPTTVPSGHEFAQEKPSTVKVGHYKPKGMLQLASVQQNANAAHEAFLSKLGFGAPDAMPMASNAWLVDKTKTVDRSAILFNGPQFGFFNPSYVYEIGLHGAGFDVVGSTPFGYPMILFGHNGHITWGSTAGPLDVVDMYEEELDGEDPYQYLHKGQLLPMLKRTDTISIKGAESETVDIYRTVHGMVTVFDLQNNRAFSKKRSWEGYEVQTLVGWIESTKAKNWNQFLKAAEKMAISNNWYFADQTGNIGYVSNGRIPIRREGHDLRFPVSGTGDMEWIGIKPFATNPQVYKPEQGWLANWNNKPSAETDNPDGSLYGSADRVQAIMDVLEIQDKFTSEEIWAINRRVSFIDLNIGYFKPFLIDAAAGLDPQAPEKVAVDLLAAWDHFRHDQDNDGYYDSVAQTIFDKWLLKMLEMTFADELEGHFTSRVGTAAFNYVSNGPKVLYHCLLGEDSSIPNDYDFFNGEDPNQVVIEALSAALSELSETYGAQMDNWLSPVIPHVFGINNFAGIPQAGSSEAIPLGNFMNRGTQNHMVVFDRGRVEAYNVCPPGQSGFISPSGIKDPHYEDQLQIYRDFESKPMILDLRKY